MRGLEGQKEQGGTEKVPEDIWLRTFQIQQKTKSLQIQEAEQTLHRIIPKKFMPRHSLVKLLKTINKRKSQDRNDTLPTSEKQIRRWWISHKKPWRPEESGMTIFQVLKEKNCQPRILQRRYFFRNEEEIKILSKKMNK